MVSWGRGQHRVDEVVGGRLAAGTQALRRHHRDARIRVGELGLAGEARVRDLGGTADEPALAAGDADVLGHAEVVGVLDPLGDHLRAAVLRDVLDRAQELQLHRVARDPGNEVLVGLDVLGLELGPEAQAREALAQVVDRHAESHRSVEHQRLVDEAEIHGRVVLGELDHHASRLQVEGAHEAACALLLETALHDELRGDVEEEAAVEARARERPQDLLNAHHVELEGEPGLARRREQVRRRLQHRALGAAHQRLVADDGALAETEDRLEHRRKRPRLEHVAKLLERFLPQLDRLFLHAPSRGAAPRATRRRSS